jgi:ABC-type molybdate transport system substrate-binding protein
MRASSSGRAAAFFSASDPSLSQEAAYGKINAQSACALNTVYNVIWFLEDEKYSRICLCRQGRTCWRGVICVLEGSH